MVDIFFFISTWMEEVESSWEISSFRDLSIETYRNFELLIAKLIANAPWLLHSSEERLSLSYYLQRLFLDPWHCRFRFFQHIFKIRNIWLVLFLCYIRDFAEVISQA